MATPSRVLKSQAETGSPAACYGGRLGAGVWTQYGAALSDPIGRVHRAGAETSDTWNGYMDGAIRSGYRAAAEVLAQLNS